MMTETEVAEKLRRIEDDERLALYEPALVQVNAPLALIQTELAAEANALRDVLGWPRQRYPHRRRTSKGESP
jgi:hypothetical protein